MRWCWQRDQPIGQQQLEAGNWQQHYWEGQHHHTVVMSRPVAGSRMGWDGMVAVRQHPCGGWQHIAALLGVWHALPARPRRGSMGQLRQHWQGHWHQHGGKNGSPARSGRMQAREGQHESTVWLATSSSMDWEGRRGPHISLATGWSTCLYACPGLQERALSIIELAPMRPHQGLSA